MSNLQRPSPSPEGHHGEMLSEVLHPVTELADPPFPTDTFAILRECYFHAMDAIRDDKLEKLEAAYQFGLARCESPMERRLFAALLGVISAHVPEPCQFLTQHPIGSYRVDFFFRLPVGDRAVELVIECDGHDFHERTKAQAKRDKGRDRYLEGCGYRVIRFTGSEIWADPMVCAQQAIIIAFRERRRLLGKPE